MVGKSRVLRDNTGWMNRQDFILQDKRGRMNRQMGILQDKRGWIRIAEAFLALTIIAVVLMSAYSIRKPDNQRNIYKLEDAILDEIVQTPAMRTAVLKGEADLIEEMVNERLSEIFDFKIKICSVDDICNMDEYRTNVYVRERIISSTLQEYSPKKLKLFVWEK